VNTTRLPARQREANASQTRSLADARVDGFRADGFFRRLRSVRGANARIGAKARGSANARGAKRFAAVIDPRGRPCRAI